MVVREEHNVPPSSASNQAPGPSFKVGEFGVATGGGIWVAAGVLTTKMLKRIYEVLKCHRKGSGSVVLWIRRLAGFSDKLLEVLQWHDSFSFIQVLSEDWGWECVYGKSL
jgi:hypothetical protein